MRSRNPLLTCLGILSTLACARTAALPEGDLSLAVVDTIVAAGNTLLDHPAELAVDEHGLLYVTDVGVNTIVVLDSAGVVVRRIGRTGGGPGELRSPRSLAVTHDTVRLIDGGNGRLAVFITAGAAVRSPAAPPGSLAAEVSFDARGAGLVGRNGRDSALAQRFDPAGTPGARLGRPVTPVPPVWDFRAIKQQIRDGKVPAEIRSMVLPVLASTGAAWLLLQAEGIVEHYTPTDSLDWRVRLAEPEFTSMRADFFARNQADSTPSRFHQLTFFASALPVDADLWVLVRQPEAAPSLLLILAPDGRVRRRLRVPSATGVRGFGLSPDRRSLYLLGYDDAVILRARLPIGL